MQIRDYSGHHQLPDTDHVNRRAPSLSRRDALRLLGGAALGGLFGLSTGSLPVALPRRAEACGTALILSGGPNPDDPIGIDDDLYVFVNRDQVFAKDDGYARAIPPIPIEAANGDTLTVEGWDVQGFCRSISPLYLHRKRDGEMQVLDAQGLNLGCIFPNPLHHPEKFYDESFTVDIAESVSITDMHLYDFDGEDLEYLSADDHTYFDGYTLIGGTIRIEGEPTEELASLTLEIEQNGALVATAGAEPGAFGALRDEYAATGGTAEFRRNTLLFKLPAAQADLVDGSSDGDLSLRARVTTTSGAEGECSVGSVRLLVLYTHERRYGGRNEDDGGDSWVQPSFKACLEHYANLATKPIRVGDIANMNGGPFSPHKGHKNGLEADAHFDYYNDRDASTAATLIGYLNDPVYGSQITKVYVTFTKEFRKAIRGVTLDDGRSATDVIRNVRSHDTHFHWNFSPAGGGGVD